LFKENFVIICYIQKAISIIRKKEANPNIILEYVLEPKERKNMFQYILSATQQIKNVNHLNR